MPELPEVETIRRQLAPLLTGRTITDAWAFESPRFDEAPAAIGSRITGVGRRGKYLLIGLTGGRHDRRATGSGPDGGGGTAAELIVHLGMTGRLSVGAPSEEPDPHLRAYWVVDHDDRASLRFHDIRRFGRLAVVAAGRYDTLPTLAALGPEPDDESFTAEHLREAVNTSRRRVKTQLLSQRPVAGVGNIYADEALWRAGIDPRARRLTRAGAERLRDAVREVIAEGIDHGGTTLRDYRDATGATGNHQSSLDCYGRAGEPCPRCATTLRRSVLDGRGTTWCPTCQRR